MTISASPVAQTTCRDNPCYPGVRCEDMERGYMCGDCPPGYYGDGVRCRKIPTCADSPCFEGIDLYLRHKFTPTFGQNL